MGLPNTDTDNCDENVRIAAKIFAEYGDFIYNVILSKLKNKTEVDDLYQDFFLALVSKPVPPGIQNIKSYLYKAISNDIVDAYRRTQRYQELLNSFARSSNFSINKPRSSDAFSSEVSIKRIFRLIWGCLTSRSGTGVGVFLA